MRRLLLLLGCSLSLLLFALPVEAKRQGQAQQKMVQGAHMTFETSSHDFGDVARRGGALVKEFRFVNDGTAPLVIKKITKSCSCITVYYSRKPLSPGASAIIKVKYEPHKVEPGIFHKAVQIYSNASKGVYLLTIQGNSIDPRRTGR